METRFTELLGCRHPIQQAGMGWVAGPELADGGGRSRRGRHARPASRARFLATPEADVHPDHRAAILAAGTGDTVVTRTFSTMWPDAPHRVLRSCVDAAPAATGDAVATVTTAGGELHLPRLGPQAPIRVTRGNAAAMAHYAGQGVGAVTAVRPAPEIVAELASGAAALLARDVHAGVAP